MNFPEAVWQIEEERLCRLERNSIIESTVGILNQIQRTRRPSRVVRLLLIFLAFTLLLPLLDILFFYGKIQIMYHLCDCTLRRRNLPYHESLIVANRGSVYQLCQIRDAVHDFERERERQRYE